MAPKCGHVELTADAGTSPGDVVPPGVGHDYPLTFSVDYPDRSLDRISAAFRIFTIIPIVILAAAARRRGSLMEALAAAIGPADDLRLPQVSYFKGQTGI